MALEQYPEQDPMSTPLVATPPSDKTDGDWIIQCDFDGTISLEDVTDALLERFAAPQWRQIEAEWEAGRIGSGECMKRQVALLDMTSDELDEFLAGVAIDPHFAAFAAAAERLGVALEVVSDGMDRVIATVLGSNQLVGLSVRANHLVQIGERRWRLTSPHASSACVVACGTCKCELLANHRTAAHKVLFVGDGRSDFCVANKADFVLAKARLIEHCVERGIGHHPFRSFQDALPLMVHAVAPMRATV